MGSPCQPSYLMGFGGRALKSSTRSLRVSVLAAGCGVSTPRSRHSAIWCCCFFPDDGFDPVRHVSRRLARGGRRGAERRASPKRGRPGRGPPVDGLHVQFGTEASDQVVISWHTLQDVTDPRVLVDTEREGSHRSTPARTPTYTDTKSGVVVRPPRAAVPSVRCHGLSVPGRSRRRAAGSRVGHDSTASIPTVTAAGLTVEGNGRAVAHRR